MSTPEGNGQERAERRFPWRIAVAVVLLAALVWAGVWLRGASKRTEFPMKEVPMPDDLMEMGNDRLCEKAASLEVKRYPQFKSAKPLFGKFFPKCRDRADKPETGCFFAIDESEGTGTGYDVLYIDANGNLDLTDDKAVKPRLHSARLTQTDFNDIAIPGACEGGGDMAVTAALRDTAGGETSIYFATDYVRQGHVRMGGHTYTATLVRTDLTQDRYDVPSTSVRLFVPERGITIGGVTLWRWSQIEDIRGALSYMFPAGNGWCSLSTTPNGDTVTVHPYKGDLGAIRASRAGKTAGNYVTGGTLHCDTGIDVLLADRDISGPASSYGDLLMPVGDYAPQYISMRTGPFHLTVHRPHPEARHEQYAQSEYFLKVRKGSPCVLEISSTAEILWLGDDQAHVYRPGDTVSARLMLATPTVTISGLSRLGASGQLCPAIKIEDSAGNTLTEATVARAFTWQIPAGFTPRGGRETLKMTATWDTKELFGVVTGTKEIVVESTD